MTEQDRKRNATLSRIKSPLSTTKSMNISVINALYNNMLHDLNLLKEIGFLSSKDYETELSSMKEVYISKALACVGYED